MTRSASELFLPPEKTLSALRRAARGCTACPLYLSATQTVFGEGPAPAALMLVGEQPGDQEDLEGRPFVGPAGRVLDECLAAARLDRAQAYVTNAVKHFKFERRGKRRIHQKPLYREVVACRGWLDAEIDVVRPRLIVCLGATAAQSFMGSAYRFTRTRGEIVPSRWAPGWMATYHPSALLRADDPAAAEAMRGEFIADLRRAAQWLSGT